MPNKRMRRNEVCGRCGQKQKRCTCRRRFNRLIPLGIGIIVLIGLAILVMRQPPPPERITTLYDDPGADPHIMALCDSALKGLVQSHPDPAIRDTLDQLIRSGTILKNYQRTQGVAGQPLATLELVRIQDGRVMPTMIFSPDALLDPEFDRRAKQLAVRHEYGHYRQLVRGEAPRETFYARRGNIPWTWGEIRAMLIVEWPVYLDEAQFAKEQGWLDVFPMIAPFRAGPSALAQSIATDYLRSPQLQPFAPLIYTLLDSLASAAPN